MKKILFVVLLFGCISSAQAIVVGTFTAKATLKKLFTVTQVTEINFGTIYVDNIASSIVQLIPSTSVISSTGSALLAGGHTVGIFQLQSGDPNGSITVSVTPVSLTNGTDTINATLTLINGTDSNTITLDASGNANVLVGGNLNIPTGMSSGDYAGSFTVNAVYN